MRTLFTPSAVAALVAAPMLMFSAPSYSALITQTDSVALPLNFTAEYGHTLGNFSNGSTIETSGFFSRSDSGILSAGANRAVEFGPDTLTDTFVLSGLDLTPFIDTGAFDITTVLFQQTALVLGTPEGGDETGVFGGSTDLKIVMTVEYDYRPLLISIPEPGSMTLMALALAGLRLCRRR